MIRLLQFLLLLILAALVWRMVKRWLAPPADPGATPRVVHTGRCSRCGTHVPAGELDGNGTCARCRTGAD